MVVRKNVEDCETIDEWYRSVNTDVVTPGDLYRLEDIWNNTHSDEDKKLANEIGIYFQNKNDVSDESTEIKEIATWLKKYNDLHKGEHLSISNILPGGFILVVNGINGTTKFTRQSLNHIMDIATYLEDHHGARVIITGTGYHSDVYYYALHFVIFEEDEHKCNLDKLRWC